MCALPFFLMGRYDSKGKNDIWDVRRKYSQLPIFYVSSNVPSLLVCPHLFCNVQILHHHCHHGILQLYYWSSSIPLASIKAEFFNCPFRDSGPLPNSPYYQPAIRSTRGNSMANLVSERIQLLYLIKIRVMPYKKGQAWENTVLNYN